MLDTFCAEPYNVPTVTFRYSSHGEVTAAGRMKVATNEQLFINGRLTTVACYIDFCVTARFPSWLAHCLFSLPFVFCLYLVERQNCEIVKTLNSENSRYSISHVVPPETSLTECQTGKEAELATFPFLFVQNALSV